MLSLISILHYIASAPHRLHNKYNVSFDYVRTVNHFLFFLSFFFFFFFSVGNWGKLPDTFKNFWEANTTIYLTPNIPSNAAMTKPMKENITTRSSDPIFIFNKMNATRIQYTNHRPTDTQTICVDFNLPVTAGIHALTIVPTSEDKIMISTILLP